MNEVSRNVIGAALAVVQQRVADQRAKAEDAPFWQRESIEHISDAVSDLKVALLKAGVIDDDGAVAPALVEHCLFASWAPYIKIEIYARDGGHKAPRRRIELRTGAMTPWLLERALHARVACCACGRPIYPFRARLKGSGERVEKPRHVYVAVACPLHDNYGCARGKAAREAYISIEAAVRSLGYGEE